MAEHQTTAANPADRLRHAEDYVRDMFRIMGQDADADNPSMVRETAHRVLLAVYGRRLPR